MLITALSLGTELEITQDTQPTSVKKDSNGKTGMFAKELARALSGKSEAQEEDRPANIALGQAEGSDKNRKTKEPALQKADKPGETSKTVRKALQTERETGEEVLALKSAGAEGGKREAFRLPIGFATVEIGDAHESASIQQKNQGQTATAGDSLEDDSSEEAVFMQVRDNEGAAHPVAFHPAQASGPGVVTSVEAPDGGAAMGGGESLQDGEIPAKPALRGVVEVRDYRSVASSPAVGTDAPAESMKADAATERASESDRDSDGPEIRVMRTSNGRLEGNSQTTPRTPQGGSFHAYVRESLSNQIVKQSGIILRNNDRGEIRLVLKPEHLGRVRLRIVLEDNRLTGRIFVDSAFVKESFEQNMTSLYRAFRNSGFEATGFEVLLDGGEAESGLADGSQKGSSEGLPKGAGVEAAKTPKQLDDWVPILEESGWQSDLVNLMV